MRNFSICLLLAGTLGATGVAEAATPVDLPFGSDVYKFAAREVDAARIAEHYLRDGETLQRFSRRLTIADQPQAKSAKSVALGVLNIARMRTPGIAPDSFAAEGAEDHDISVSWYDLLDDGTAVDYHVARFVDLEGGGVREYHLTVRRYTNGRRPDDVFGPLRGQTEPITLQVVELMSRMDRAPVAPPKAKK